jgi:predicted transcriptional regulator
MSIPQSHSPNRDAIVEAIAADPGFPSVNLPELVADELGISRRTVQYQLAALEKAGAITWHRKTTGKARLPYWVLSVHVDHPVWAPAVAVVR